MNALVGYTGFVGGNLDAPGRFDARFHSTDISDAYGLRPDLLVYAGLRAEKFLANRAPERDLAQVEAAAENIRRIAPKRLVLISTIDVLKRTAGADETAEADSDGLAAYGANRRWLERRVRAEWPDALIVRLPALFGKRLKKNFIYDFIHVIPAMLSAAKMEELSARDPAIRAAYGAQREGFYRLRELDAPERAGYAERFRALGFTALNFTDSRSRYQFYPLARLWDDLQTALANDLRLWHPATEPVSAGALYEYLTGERFVNELPGEPANYDYRTAYAPLFGGANGYLMDGQSVMRAVAAFVDGERREGEEATRA